MYRIDFIENYFVIDKFIDHKVIDKFERVQFFV